MEQHVHFADCPRAEILVLTMKREVLGIAKQAVAEAGFQAPHGTVGRSKAEERKSRPGWWLPLYGYAEAPSPLELAELQHPSQLDWIRNWIETKKKESGTVASPFQLHGESLRAQQAYLAKMPSDFVNRWDQLSTLVDTVQEWQESLASLTPATVASRSTVRATFKPKSEEDYTAIVRTARQVRTRKHETLVNRTAELLKKGGSSSLQSASDRFANE